MPSPVANSSPAVLAPTVPSAAGDGSLPPPLGRTLLPSLVPPTPLTPQVERDPPRLRLETVHIPRLHLPQSALPFGLTIRPVPGNYPARYDDLRLQMPQIVTELQVDGEPRPLTFRFTGLENTFHLELDHDGNTSTPPILTFDGSQSATPGVLVGYVRADPPPLEGFQLLFLGVANYGTRYDRNGRLDLTDVTLSTRGYMHAPVLTSKDRRAALHLVAGSGQMAQWFPGRISLSGSAEVGFGVELGRQGDPARLFAVCAVGPNLDVVRSNNVAFEVSPTGVCNVALEF